MQISEISLAIEAKALDESIQDLIKDMKSTQHGDRTNPLYDLSKDFHIEGGVWKHTLIALQSLSRMAAGLDQVFVGAGFEEAFNNNLPDVRAAALYHDIGKLTTQEPSKKRPGSYSFPGHGGGKELINSILDTYGLKTNELVADLAGEHHAREKDIPTLKAEGWTDEKLMLLAIVKGVDSMAVGPKGLGKGVEHIIPFAKAIGLEPTDSYTEVPDEEDVNEDKDFVEYYPEFTA